MTHHPFTLSVATPCQENWSDFAPTTQGGFCQACQTDVIDFTAMSDEEIIRFFQEKPSQTCGRFNRNQLRLYTEPAVAASRTPVRRRFLHAGLVSILTLWASRESHAQMAEKTSIGTIPLHTFVASQNTTEAGSEKYPSDGPARTIRGVVRDAEHQPLPGVSVYLKGTTTGTSTDANGRFEFPQQVKPGEVLIFAFIGFDNEEYVIPKNSQELTEIVMEMDSMQLMGKVVVDQVYTAPTTGIGKWWQKVKSVF
jgi:hypothetical protein